jgi:phosphatidate cytidylyltransferase
MSKSSVSSSPIPVKDLGKRVGVAAVGIPLALFVLVAGGWILTLFVALLAVMADREMHSLALARGVRTFPVISLVGTLTLVLLAGAFRSFPGWAPWALGLLLFLFFLSSASAVRFRPPDHRPLLAASLTLVSALWWGGGFSFAVFLRHLPDTQGWPEGVSSGLALVLFPLAVTWVSDTAAYLVGHAFGRRKMAPTVSPNKTMEGALASLVSSVVVGGLMGGIFLTLHPAPWRSVILGGGMGLLMGITVQLGDLIESLFKREAGVKDSGDLLPGHGGILDRFDALIFTLPLTYALVALAGHLS